MLGLFDKDKGNAESKVDAPDAFKNPRLFIFSAIRISSDIEYYFRHDLGSGPINY